MALTETSYLQFTPDLKICRILNGMWQVSGAHGHIDLKAALLEMFDYHAAGFTTWDLADHYGPAEDLIGEFLSQLSAREGEASLSKVQAFTKWVPQPAAMSRQVVEHAVDRSRQRMHVESIDLVQFHWWDYADLGYLDALQYLASLRDQGQIRHLALTNFDTAHLQTIQAHGNRIISNQVQFSLIDMRPEVAMVPFCLVNNVWLLPYGVLCGGLLSEKYLDQPEPHSWALNTASLQKYKRMIEAWGGWTLFQELLLVLNQVAKKHKVSVANVAIRYILERPAVAGVIIGARLGISSHYQESARVFDFALDEEDLIEIGRIQGKSRDLYRLIGDCGDEYRH